MLPVRVTVTMGRKTVPLEKVTDSRIARGLADLGKNIGTRLAAVTCPVHGRGPESVRVHVDARGTPDLAYDSCCAELATLVSRALG
jgi:hypothetical protein